MKNVIRKSDNFAEQFIVSVLAQFLVAGSRIAPASYRTPLRISTVGKSGHAQLWTPKCRLPVDPYPTT